MSIALVRPASPEVTLAEDIKEVDVEVKEGETPESNLLPPEGWSEASWTSVDSVTVDAWLQSYAPWTLSPWFWPTLTLLVAWALLWKGLALWHAARNGQRNWFIALLVVNTLGLVEIGYLKWGQRKEEEGKSGGLTKPHSKRLK